MRTLIGWLLSASVLLAAYPSAAQAPPFLLEWGSKGFGDGQFAGPEGIAVDPSGDVYVTDFFQPTAEGRMQKFSGMGVFLLKWGTPGVGNGEFVHPRSVAADGAGNIYVGDAHEPIQKFTSTGTFLTKWGGFGTGNGQFVTPWGIAVEAAGYFYVCDLSNENASIQKFTSNGAFVMRWGTAGLGDGEFSNASALAFDALDHLYEVDLSGNRIQVFKTDGTFVTSWGSFGSGPGQFYYPYAVAVDGTGNVFVIDFMNCRVQKFGPIPVPTLRTTWGPRESRDWCHVSGRCQRFDTLSTSVRFPSKPIHPRPPARTDQHPGHQPTPATRLEENPKTRAEEQPGELSGSHGAAGSAPFG